MLQKILVIVSLCLSINAFAKQYAVVIDAGSSGSRVYVYSFEPSDSLEKTAIKQVASLKVEPGISAYAGVKKMKPVKQYLQPLISFAKEKIPADAHKKTPLFWYSTAGMRLLSPVKQRRTYKRIEKIIKQQSDFKIAAIQTISGSMEGVLMWLSANYQNQSLSSKQPVGIIDMGGGSTQIVFATKSPQHTVKVHFPAKTFELFSHSFLGMGRNALRSQFTNDAACFSQGFQLPSQAYAQGQFAECQTAIMQFVQLRHKISKKIPTLPSINFVAFDGFYKMAKRLGLKTLSIQSLDKAGNKACRMKWKSHSPSAKNANFDNCFNSAYFSILLAKYGFSPKAKLTVKEGSWTLGTAVLLAGQGHLELAGATS